jgi:hypothetical protein
LKTPITIPTAIRMRTTTDNITQSFFHFSRAKFQMPSKL